MLWIIDENTDSAIPAHQMQRSAFFKSRRDVTDDLISIGAKPLSLYLYYDRDESDDSLRSRVDGMLAGFKRGDTVIFQLPLFIRPKNIAKILDVIHNGLGGKAIALIHDYEPFRSVRAAKEDVNSDAWLDQYSYKTMAELLPLFDGWIVPSERFKEKLCGTLDFEGIVVVQGPWSYHYCYDSPDPVYDKRVVYAAESLSKPFLELVPADWQLALYGDQPSEDTLQRANTEYMGSFGPSELPNHLGSGFGLLWESETYPGVTGELGDYSRLNYPHKLSLYMAAGLPVFVWDQAAPASWVKSNHIGYAISDLSEIKAYLDTLSEETYADMRQNVTRIGDLVRSGLYVKSAVLEAVKQVNQVTLRF